MATEPKRGARGSIYAKGGKIGEMETFKFSLNSNDEQHVTDDGGVFTDGKITGTISCTTIDTTESGSAFLVNAMLNKETISMQAALVQGKMFSMKARVTKFDTDGDVKSGKQMGNFEFMFFDADQT